MASHNFRVGPHFNSVFLFLSTGERTCYALQVTPNLYGNLVANTAAGIAGGSGVMPGGTSFLFSFLVLILKRRMKNHGLPLSSQKMQFHESMPD